jgi:hypothetical protein
MNTSGVHGQNFASLARGFRLRRGLTFGVIIVTALLAFEIFNYSTTDFALSDLLGDLEFAGLRWATILAIAFCGIDFAGIARLFTPEEGQSEPTEVWYLFGAWLLAATMNAMLTWWGVSIAILNHDTLGNAVVSRESLLRVVPIFVAVMVWLIRVLIIGTFSVAGDRLFSQSEARLGDGQRASARPARSMGSRANAVQTPLRAAGNAAPRPAPKPVPQNDSPYARPEPTYHPVSMGMRSGGNGSGKGTFSQRR